MRGEKDRKVFAQTVSELAIFGAILIFVLGLIVRYATNFNFIQDQSLEAMRLAFRESFMSGEAGLPAKNFASVIFIEDRKDVENTKYGSFARNPYVVSGSGTFTRNLNLGIEYGRDDEIPVTDLYINGNHFTFTTAGFRNLVFRYGNFNCDYTSRQCTSQLCGASCGDPEYDGEDGNGRYTFKCDPSSCRWDVKCGCTPISPVTFTIFGSKVLNFEDVYTPFGYTKVLTFLTKIDNEDPRFCSGSDTGVCPSSNLTADDRFDLDRDGNTDVVGNNLRANFAWQWYKVYAHTQDIDLEAGENVTLDLDGDLKEEQILMYRDRDGVISTPDEKKRDAEVSGSFNNMVSNIRMQYSTLPIDQISFLDFQSGDFDFTLTNADQAIYGVPAAGLIDDVATIFSFAPSGDGGRLTLIEGKIFGPGQGQKVRQTQRRNIIDIIERRIQLSNDTGRFDPGNPKFANPEVEMACGDTDDHVKSVYDRPLECSDKGYRSCCRGEGTEYKTCFDRDCLILYVRSRIKDEGGRRWITDIIKPN